MTADATAQERGTALAETFGFAATAALLFGLTWQGALHGTDWRWFVLWLDEPGAVHPQHPGYLVVAHAVRLLLSPLQPDAYAVLRVLSVLGGSVAIAGFHRAAVGLSGDRRFARVATLWLMVSPALWHHATVVELHAPFLAVVAWGTWAAVQWSRAGAAADAMRWAIVTGVLSGAATTVHATGHLFVVVVATAIALARPRRQWRRSVATLAVYAVTHAVVWGALFVAIRATGSLPESVGGLAARPGALAAPDNPIDYLLRWWEGMDFGSQVGPTTLHEWLEPYAPASVLVVVALLRKRWRPAASLLCAALALYLVATVALVHAWTDERGAYLLPLLFPAVALSLAIVPRWSWPLLLLVGLGCGLVFRGEPGRLPPDRGFGAAAVAMANEEPTVFFVADFPEMDGAFLSDPRLDLLLARREYDELRAVQVQQGNFAPTPDQIAGWLTLLTVQASEKSARLVITDRAVAWLAERVAGFDAGFAAFEARLAARRLPPATGIAGWSIP